MATSPTNAYEGGCLCGAIRFASGVAPTWSGYCHCRLCQLSSGSPVLAWASFPLAAFDYAPPRYDGEGPPEPVG